MMSIPERSPERDAAIDLVLPHIVDHGWSLGALRHALRATGGVPADAERLFPGGATDMIETWCDLADRRMAGAAAALNLDTQRVGERVRALVALRLAQSRPFKEAVRRALGLMSLPSNARLAAATTARTVDAIWHAAGDTSADFSWYTKRATLAAVYAATLLVWLRDPSEDDAGTLDFLDRRLARIARIGRLRGRMGRMFACCRERAA
jgi:ubiquinone biosynthesis protein COQ9